jgi:hypothetical protein
MEKEVKKEVKEWFSLAKKAKKTTFHVNHLVFEYNHSESESEFTLFCGGEEIGKLVEDVKNGYRLVLREEAEKYQNELTLLKKEAAAIANAETVSIKEQLGMFLSEVEKKRVKTFFVSDIVLQYTKKEGTLPSFHVYVRDGDNEYDSINEEEKKMAVVQMMLENAYNVILYPEHCIKSGALKRIIEETYSVMVTKVEIQNSQSLSKEDRENIYRFYQDLADYYGIEIALHFREKYRLVRKEILTPKPLS